MFKLLLLNLLLMAVSVTVSASGGWSGGGGNAIYMGKGQYRLLDLLDPKDIPQQNYEQEANQLWESTNLVSQLGVESPHFFDSAIQLLKSKNEKYPIFSKLIDELHKLNPILMEPRLKRGDEMKSQSTDFFKQEPLAAYEGNTLYISKRVYESMPAEDQKALAIHEALRHLNFQRLLTSPLSTEEIEVATRALLGKSRVNDDVNSVMQKLNSINSKAVVCREKQIRDIEKLRDVVQNKDNTKSKEQNANADSSGQHLQIAKKELHRRLTTLSLSDQQRADSNKKYQLAGVENKIFTTPLGDCWKFNIQSPTYEPVNICSGHSPNHKMRD